MQHDLSGSGHDLDLRSNFQHDFLRSNYISFDAARQEKHDDGKINIVSVKTAIFLVFAPWTPNR